MSLRACTHVSLLGFVVQHGDAGAARTTQAKPATRKHRPAELQGKGGHQGTPTKNPVAYTQRSHKGHREARWVHTGGHKEPRRVHRRNRARERKRDADGPPTPSGVRTQANALHESRLGTGGTASVRVCVETCECQCKRQVPRSIVEVWEVFCSGL